MKPYRWLCVIAVLAAFLLHPASIVRAVDAGRGSRMVEFIDGEGNVRAGPGIGHKILFQPATGTQCLVISEKGAWKEVKFDDGSKGWAHRKNLKPVEAAPVERSEDQMADTHESVIATTMGGPGSYVLSAAVLRHLDGGELDDVRRSVACDVGDAYEIRLPNDDRAILCTRKSRFSGKETFSLRVKTAGLHDVPSKEKKDGSGQTVIVYEEVE